MKKIWPVLKISNYFSKHIAVMLSFFTQHVGDSASAIKDLASGSSSHEVLKRLESAQRPVVILGADQLKTPEGAAILAYTQELALRLQDKLQDKSWKVGCEVMTLKAERCLYNIFF